MMQARKIVREIAAQYELAPFTDFASITPMTRLDSLNLNWTERDLPEHLRTKHVHRLHPYLGKFVPQLVEIFLRKYQPKVVCDPFCGSGTTLVEALALDIDSVGCDISSFNCLLTKVKTDKYDLDLLEREARDICQEAVGDTQAILLEQAESYETSDYLRQWFAPQALLALKKYRVLIDHYEYRDVLKVILSRAARSARLTTHFDLDFPKAPQMEPYYCYKHSRTCQPTANAAQFIRRYTYDTIKRIREFAQTRQPAKVTILCEDARTATFPQCDLVLTSPPYVGLIDYHEQHKYAYELLGLERKDSAEIGPAQKGTSNGAKQHYIDDITRVFQNVKSSLKRGGRMAVVVNDKWGIYPEIASKLGVGLEVELRRHVNRRTGRRADDFFESILIWRCL